MNGNAELLNFIYQNSQMGVETMEQLGGLTKDCEFRSFLEAAGRDTFYFTERRKSCCVKAAMMKRAWAP